MSTICSPYGWTITRAAKGLGPVEWGREPQPLDYRAGHGYRVLCHRLRHLGADRAVLARDAGGGTMGNPVAAGALGSLRQQASGASAGVKRVGIGIIGGGLMGKEAASAFGRWFMLND